MPTVPKRIKVRYATLKEVETIKGWRKLHKEVDEFVYLWTRYKRWESEPPIVVQCGGKLAGYHGVSFTKSRYVNSMSQFVLEQYRGRRLAGEMIDFLLKESYKKEMLRLRFRTPKVSDGLDCWTGLGAIPFGECDKDFWFDLDLVGITNIRQFIKCASRAHLNPTSDKRRISWYKRGNVRPLISVYEEIL